MTKHATLSICVFVSASPRLTAALVSVCRCRSLNRTVSKLNKVMLVDWLDSKIPGLTRFYSGITPGRMFAGWLAFVIIIGIPTALSSLTPATLDFWKVGHTHSIDLESTHTHTHTHSRLLGLIRSHRLPDSGTTVAILLLVLLHLHDGLRIPRQHSESRIHHPTEDTEACQSGGTDLRNL